MIKETFYKRIKNSACPCGTMRAKFAIRICDVCGKETECHFSTVRIGRKRRGDEVDLCSSCSLKDRKQISGSKHKNWKNGLSKGYRVINVDKKRYYEHRWVMSQHIGREFEKGEIVHHIDLNKINNDIDNLYLFSNDANKEHTRCHRDLEYIGLEFLTKKIWFDFIDRVYKLEEPVKEFQHQIVNVPFFKTRIKKHRGTPYVYANIGEGKIKRYHIIVAELMYGRNLYRNEDVHHVDGDTLNNLPSNLVVFTKSEHTKCHYSLQECAIELYKQGLVGFDKETGKYFVVEK